MAPLSWMCKLETAVCQGLFHLMSDRGWMIYLLSTFGTALCSRSHPCDTGWNAELRSQSLREIFEMDSVSSNIPESAHLNTWFVFENSSAVIQVIHEKRSPNLRHVSRTHRGNSAWLFERISSDPSIRFRKDCVPHNAGLSCCPC